MRFRFVPIAFFGLFAPGLIAQDATEATTPIQVEEAPADLSIEDRLRAIYDAVGGFEPVTISVESGVVTLTGEVPSAKTREEAVSLANRTDGVVIVLDRMEVTTEIRSQFAPAFDKLREMGRAFVVKLPLFGAAAVVLLVTFYLARLVGRRRGWLRRVPFSSLGKQLALRIVRAIVIVAGILVALELLDATAIVGAVLGAAGLAGLALGFAFKNIVENYLAGILLSTRNPFEIGDAVEIGGMTGKVALLTSRDTVLVTLDGNHLRIPNATVMNSVLLNYTRNPKRRFDFTVGVSTEFDLQEVRRIGLEAISANPGVLADPKPLTVIDALGDSSVSVKFFAWLDQTESDFLKTKSESIRLVKEAFDEAGIEMPEPIYRVHLRGGPAPFAADSVVSATPTTSRVDRPSEPVADLSVDRTIDEQIAEESSQSEEKNLLADEGGK